jgi:hypothetical protein
LLSREKNTVEINIYKEFALSLISNIFAIYCDDDYDKGFEIIENAIKTSIYK